MPSGTGARREAGEYTLNRVQEEEGFLIAADHCFNLTHCPQPYRTAAGCCCWNELHFYYSFSLCSSNIALAALSLKLTSYYREGLLMIRFIILQSSFYQRRFVLPKNCRCTSQQVHHHFQWGRIFSIKVCLRREPRPLLPRPQLQFSTCFITGLHVILNR